MNRIAFIIGDRSIYWSSILLTIAAAVAVCVFLTLYLRKENRGVAAATVVPMAIVLSLFLARFVHWYCRWNSYPGMLEALTNLSSGSFALMGVFAGCFLTAVIVRLLRLTDNLPEMLDCMALGGAAGIAVGRMASFFDTTARGLLVENVRTLPWVYPIVNGVSGAEEYRLATFLFQAVVTGLIFLVLLATYLKEEKRGTGKDGDICLLFALSYGASQVVLDSTRYDSLFFRSNGFVSIVQVLGALGIGLAIIVFSVRMVRARGWDYRYLALWLVTAGLLGLGGYMEYHVQRHAAEAVFAYSVMSACLLGLISMGVFIRHLAKSERKERYAGRFAAR